MSDVKILQVDISGMDRSQANMFCNMLQGKVGDGIIIVPHIGESGKITSINAADIVYFNGKKMTCEDLYNMIMELDSLREQAEDLKEQISNLGDQLLQSYSNDWEDE